MGPIQIFVLGFEDFRATGGIAAELVKLSDAGIVRIVDARFLLKEGEADLIAAHVSDLTDAEREDLRVAAGALMGLGAGAVLAGEEGAIAGSIIGADAALGIGEIGLSAENIKALGEEMKVGDALLLLVIENVWAAGFRDALRDANLMFADQGYLTPEGLVELGALLGIEMAYAESIG